MRLRSDEDFNKMEIAEVDHLIEKYSGFASGESHAEKLETLKRYERTRSFCCWHDASSINNHSYMLFLVSVIYDEAVFKTQEEVGDGIDVQAEVEIPEIYILGRSRGNEEQLDYAKARLQDLELMKEPIVVDNIIIQDTMRAFHGDMLANAVEAGVQKGGNFYCATCHLHADDSTNLALAVNPTVKTLEENQLKIIQGDKTRAKAMKKDPKPCKGLTKSETLDELIVRKKWSTKDKRSSAVEVQAKMKDILKGVNSIPALLFDSPLTRLKDCSCESYEILPIGII